jgi:hypothetical protein
VRIADEMKGCDGIALAVSIPVVPIGLQLEQGFLIHVIGGGGLVALWCFQSLGDTHLGLMEIGEGVDGVAGSSSAILEHGLSTRQ